jgi:hypothetical protein
MLPTNPMLHQADAPHLGPPAPVLALGLVSTVDALTARADVRLTAAPDTVITASLPAHIGAATIGAGDRVVVAVYADSIAILLATY